MQSLMLTALPTWSTAPSPPPEGHHLLGDNSAAAGTQHCVSPTRGWTIPDSSKISWPLT